MDCTRTDSKHVNAIICKAKGTSYNKIRLKFPQDENPHINVDTHCSSSDFINGFNDGGKDLHRTQKVVTLYGTAFDLAILKEHTNPERTKTVYVRADYVYMSEELYLTYDLKIRARKVFINDSLIMEMDMNTFSSRQKHYTVNSKQIQLKGPSRYYVSMFSAFLDPTHPTYQ